jgi:hypothetical protein
MTAKYIKTSHKNINTSTQSIDTSRQNIDVLSKNIDASGKNIEALNRHIDTLSRCIDTLSQNIDAPGKNIDKQHSIFHTADVYACGCHRLFVLLHRIGGRFGLSNHSLCVDHRKDTKYSPNRQLITNILF